MKKLFRHIRSVGLARSVTLMTGALGATALFVWTLGFAVTTLSQRASLATEMTAPYDCWVSTGRAGGAAPKGFGIQELVPGAPTLMIAPSVIEATRGSPLVASVDAVSIFRAQVRYEGFTTLSTTPPLTMGMSAVSQYRPAFMALAQGRWPLADAGTPEVAVFDTMFRDRNLDIPALGTTLQLSTGQGVVNATLVGLFKGRKWVSGFPTGFVSDNAMQTLMPDFADPALANLLLCRTGREDAALALREELIAACGEETGIRVVDRRALVAELQTDLLKNFKRQAPLLLVLAVLMAACLISTAMRISIQTRLRVFAQYRILGMTRKQLVRFVVRELSALLVCAWALGCAVGFAILTVFVRRHAADFPDGIPHALYGLAPAVAFALLAAVSAVVLAGPLRKLFRAEPLAGLNPEAVVPLRVSPLKTVLGVVLTPMVLVLLLPFRCSPEMRSALILLVGFPSHLFGLYWLLPALLAAVDRAFSVGGDRVLLRNATGRSYGRTQALIVTLMTGLGAYCAIQIWGASMIAPFIPSRELPDVIAAFEPQGLPPPAMKRFAGIEGIRDFQAFTAEQYVLDETLLDNIERHAGSRPIQNNVLVINFEADGEPSPTPAPHFKFLIPDSPGACIIPAMFARQGGLALGDGITIRRVHPDGSITAHTWIIAGIVELNWHLFTARSGLRGRGGAPFGTLAPVFIRDPGFAGENTPLPFAWFNLAEGVDFADMDTHVKETLSDIRQEGRATASPPSRARGGQSGELRVTLHQREEIAEGTSARGVRLVGELARLPFYALILLTVGIVAIVQANIQSRDNEFAMLRGIGMTRRQLFALLCNEVVLLLVCGIAASVLFGICVGWVFTAWTRAWMPFGGLPIRLHIPWPLLGQGIALTLALGMAYALIPITGFMRKK